jgi:hypothetical protein
MITDKMRYSGHVALVGVVKNAHKIFVGNLNEGDHSEDLGIDGRIICEYILGKYGGKFWTGFLWLGIGNSDGTLRRGFYKKREIS